MQEPQHLDIKLGPEIGQTSPSPTPEPVAGLTINVGQAYIENPFSKGELPTGTKEVGNPNKDLTVALVEGQALQQIFGYMQEERNRERSGFLVGRYLDISGGRVVTITDFIPAQAVQATGASVTFDVNGAEVQRWIEKNRPESQLQMVGWVHSHPFWTPAPSADDVPIMENQFNLPHNVTLIVNQNTMEVGDFRYINGQVVNTGGFYLTTSGLRGLREVTITSDTRLDQKSGGQKVALNSLPDADGAVLKVYIDISTFQRFKDKLTGSIDKFISLVNKFGNLLSHIPEQRVVRLLSLTPADIDRISPDEILKITAEELETGDRGNEVQTPIKITKDDLK